MGKTSARGSAFFFYPPTPHGAQRRLIPPPPPPVGVHSADSVGCVIGTRGQATGGGWYRRGTANQYRKCDAQRDAPEAPGSLQDVGEPCHGRGCGRERGNTGRPAHNVDPEQGILGPAPGFGFIFAVCFTKCAELTAPLGAIHIIQRVQRTVDATKPESSKLIKWLEINKKNLIFGPILLSKKKL